jgi:predicted permease
MFWDPILQDFRYTARMLLRAPGFALTVILVTALGIGANTASFSMADFVLIRPLDFPDPDSLVRLCEGPRTGGGWGCNNQLSPANYRDFKEQTTSFESLGAFRRDAVNIVGGGEPQRVPLALVTSEVLPLLGVQPALGRVFDRRTVDADSRTVVISFALWKTHLGGSPDILGSTVNLDGAAYKVIGVMPETFRFPTRDAQLWVPLQLSAEDYRDRTDRYLEAVGRLAPGVTFEQARTDLNSVATRLASTYRENEETGISFFRMREEFSPQFKLMLQVLAGASLCILLLTCANLGNLLLARAVARESELAVRVAVGAGRGRLMRQLITESVVLAVIGGAAGVLVAVIVLPLLSLMVPPTLAIGSDPRLNLRMLAVAALFTGLTGIGFGIVPAVFASRRATSGILRGARSGGRRQLSRSLLVAVEVAASVVLLVSAGLLIRAMLRVQAVSPGFRTEDVLTLRTVLPRLNYPTVEKREQFYRNVLSEVRRLPGVDSAAYTNGLPMVVTGLVTRVVLPGQEVRREANYLVSRRFITPQFFSAMGIPFVRGRDLSESESAGRSRVAVVSQSFVQRYWPSEEGLGKVFLYQNEPRTVVGVVGDIKVRGLERTSEPQLYLPSSDVPDTVLTAFDPQELVIRANGSVTSLVPAVREIIRAVDADQPISHVMTGDELLDTQTAERRAQVQVLAALAGVALLLAALGIYGLLAYTIEQRRHEIGLRLALGAEPARIARRVVWQSLMVVLLGLIPGLGAALAAGRSMKNLLFGVPPGDPVTFFATVSVCVIVSVFGALVPAIRAVRVSPMSILRL